jgi:hypothetical protein
VTSTSDVSHSRIRSKSACPTHHPRLATATRTILSMTHTGPLVCVDDHPYSWVQRQLLSLRPWYAFVPTVLSVIRCHVQSAMPRCPQNSTATRQTSGPLILASCSSQYGFCNHTIHKWESWDSAWHDRALLPSCRARQGLPPPVSWPLQIHTREVYSIDDIIPRACSPSI